MEIRPANGVTGVLCRAFGGGFFFRVYDADHGFVDYDIRHNDLQVTIDDADSAFYEKDGVLTLDHSPSALGIK